MNFKSADRRKVRSISDRLRG